MNKIISRVLCAILAVFVVSFLVKSVFFLGLTAVLAYVAFAVYQNGITASIASLVALFKGK